MDMERMLLLGGIALIIGILLYYGWRNGYLNFITGLFGKKDPIVQAADEEKKMLEDAGQTEHDLIDAESAAMHDAVDQQLEAATNQIDNEVANGTVPTNNGEGFIRFRSPFKRRY